MTNPAQQSPPGNAGVEGTREKEIKMSKGTVQIQETQITQSFTDDDGDLTGVQTLARFDTTWPSGKVFTKHVVLEDDVNERRRQVDFVRERGYDVEFVKPVYTKKGQPPRMEVQKCWAAV